MVNQPKLCEQDRAEIAERYELGETMGKLAKEYKVTLTTVSKYLDQAGAKKSKVVQRNTPATLFLKFAKAARSLTWRADGREKKTWEKWEARIEELRQDGLPEKQALVQASKDFPHLHHLFIQYPVSEYDPDPESHPHILMHGNPSHVDGIENEEKEQSFRENLNWAVEAAGNFLRTNEPPTSTPNDKAYFLYRQACDNPKEFLGKVTQVEARENDEPEGEQEKSGKRSIREIEEMLNTLEKEGESV